MGRRGRKRAEQKKLVALPPEPAFPIETWSVEMPFDSSDYLTSVAVPTYEDDEKNPKSAA